MNEPRHVKVLALPSASLVSIFGPAEVFGEVNAHFAQDIYKLSVLSAGFQRCTHLGGHCLMSELNLEESSTKVDTLIIAGGLAWPHPLSPAKISELSSWIQHHSLHTRRLVGISSGSMLLAGAGLLNQKQATTHWSCVRKMSETFPNVRLVPDQIYVKDGRCYTAAGGSSAIDLAVSLVEEDLGTEVAREIAKRLVLALRRSGTHPQVSTTLLAQTTETGVFTNLLVWMSENVDKNLSVATLARHAAMSPRNFARHFVREVGKTPGRHVTDLRLETARRHLADQRLGLGEVARASGMGSVEVLRRLFTKTYGLSPVATGFISVKSPET